MHSPSVNEVTQVSLHVMSMLHSWQETSEKVADAADIKMDRRTLNNLYGRNKNYYGVSSSGFCLVLMVGSKGKEKELFTSTSNLQCQYT